MVESFQITEWSGIQTAIWIPDWYLNSNSALNSELPFEYQTSKYWTSESSSFRCFRYSDVFYFDFHCTTPQSNCKTTTAYFKGPSFSVPSCCFMLLMLGKNKWIRLYLKLYILCESHSHLNEHWRDSRPLRKSF